MITITAPKKFTAAELSNEEYHAGPGISKSGLDAVHKTPAHYFAAYLDPEREPRKQTPALIFGSAFHAILESNELFEREYCRGIECDRRTKAGKIAYADHLAATEGKRSLSAEEYENILRMRDKVFSRASMSVLLKDVEAEPSFYWFEPSLETGQSHLARARGDIVSVNDNYIMDWKTTDDLDEDAFIRSAWKYRYHVQAAWYLNGATLTTGREYSQFLYCAIEKTPPFAIKIREASPEYVRRGFVEYSEDFARYSQAIHANDWPDFPDEITPIDAPRWAK